MDIRSTEFSITYPKCDYSEQELITYYTSQFFGKLSYIAATQEEHEDKTKHLHVHLQFKKQFRATTRTFDLPPLTFGLKPFHPNVQKTISTSEWNEYIRKDKEPLEWGEIRLISTKRKKKSKPSNMELLTGNLQDLIDTDAVSLFSLSGILNARRLYYEVLVPSLLPDVGTHLPDNWLGLSLPLHPSPTKQRHYWLWSAMPNKGKSTFLKKLMKNYRSSFYSCSEKYQTIKSDSQLVLLDEFGPNNLVANTILNQMCDGTYKYPVKGSNQVTLNDPWIIICSNFPILSIYPQSNGRVEARFNEICLDNYLFI